MLVILFSNIYFDHFISLVPEDASEPVRRFVEALFIIHTETKLNTSGRLVGALNNDSDQQNDLYNIAASSPMLPLSIDAQILDREEWCLDLMSPRHRHQYPEV